MIRMADVTHEVAPTELVDEMAAEHLNQLFAADRIAVSIAAAVLLVIGIAAGVNVWVFVLVAVIMGWLVVTAVEPLGAELPRLAIIWLFVGGIVYTLGTIFYLLKRVPYHHAVWHLFVLVGSVFHFVAILYASNFPGSLP